MKISTSHLKRYKEIAFLLWKYGRSDLVKQMGIDHTLEPLEVRHGGTHQANPEELADDLEAMGPTFVKLGQVLSGRADLLPEPYLKALARLQDKVKPFPYAAVEQTVMSELGVRISKAFSRFDPEPIAAASLGQVHSAALRDGRAVVVKIQRPDIRGQIAEDFEVLGQIADFIDAHTALGRRYRFLTVLDEFRHSLKQELNYEHEAQNLITLGKNLVDFKLIQVPQPVLDYCTRCVLTMEEVQGHKITALSPIARLDIDGAALAEEVFKAYLKQVVVDGLFHADPHPGNVFLTNDGRIALLDLGMTGHTTSGLQENLLKVLLAVSDGNGEEAADVVTRLSQKMEHCDPVEFRRRVGQIIAVRQNQGLQNLDVGRSLMAVSRSALESGFWVPSELTLLGKTLLQLDEIGRILDPNFDPNACVRRHARELLLQRMKKDITQGSLLGSLLELKGFVSHLPTRLNRIFDSVANAELEGKVKTPDASIFLDGMQKIANRITAGIVLAALIIGASLMMRVPTSFQLFGYPGLAMFCFILAAGGGIWLLIMIFLHDQNNHRNKP